MCSEIDKLGHFWELEFRVDKRETMLILNNDYVSKGWILWLYLKLGKRVYYDYISNLLKMDENYDVISSSLKRCANHDYISN